VLNTSVQVVQHHENKTARTVERRFIDFGFKERKDVVQCYHCGIMLPRDEMFLHMEEHHVKFYSHMCGPARPYQCSVCRRTMETEKQHAGHRCQEAKGPFKCDTCNVIFEWRSELVEHLNNIHSIRAKIDLKAKVQMEKDLNLKVKTDHRCEYCDMKFLSKKKLVEHLVNHKNLQQQQPETAVMLGQHQPEVAVMLGQQQQDVQQQQHPNTAIANIKTCKLCNQGFLDDNSLANHVTDLHTVLNTCDECNNEFPTANLFNKHQQTCLFEPRCFPCQKCESVWSSNASLRLHYLENHQESVDVCGVCGYVVENSKALELHWKTSHLSWTPVLHCDFCDREFYAQGSLDNHTYKVHKIQTSFSCELCQFHCTRRSELETHIQGVHYSNERFFCDICQFSTFQKSKLAQHKKRTHSYECSHCSSTFETSREKNQHEKDHLAKKPKRKRF